METQRCEIALKFLQRLQPFTEVLRSQKITLLRRPAWKPRVLLPTSVCMCVLTNFTVFLWTEACIYDVANQWNIQPMMNEINGKNVVCVAAYEPSYSADVNSAITLIGNTASSRPCLMAVSWKRLCDTAINKQLIIVLNGCVMTFYVKTVRSKI